MKPCARARSSKCVVVERVVMNRTVPSNNWAVTGWPRLTSTAIAISACAQEAARSTAFSARWNWPPSPVAAKVPA